MSLPNSANRQVEDYRLGSAQSEPKCSFSLDYIFSKPCIYVGQSELNQLVDLLCLVGSQECLELQVLHYGKLHILIKGESFVHI